MKIITINLPESYLSSIKVLKDLGAYPSRSEAIRIALHDFLSNELKLYQELNEANFKMLVRSNTDKRRKQ